jgi:hypothetical protein
VRGGGRQAAAGDREGRPRRRRRGARGGHGGLVWRGHGLEGERRERGIRSRDLIGKWRSGGAGERAPHPHGSGSGEGEARPLAAVGRPPRSTGRFCLLVKKVRNARQKCSYSQDKMCTSIKKYCNTVNLNLFFKSLSRTSFGISMPSRKVAHLQMSKIHGRSLDLSSLLVVVITHCNT